MRRPSFGLWQVALLIACLIMLLGSCDRPAAMHQQDVVVSLDEIKYKLYPMNFGTIATTVLAAIIWIGQIPNVISEWRKRKKTTSDTLVGIVKLVHKALDVLNAFHQALGAAVVPALLVASSVVVHNVRVLNEHVSYIESTVYKFNEVIDEEIHLRLVAVQNILEGGLEALPERVEEQLDSPYDYTPKLRP